MQRDEVEFFLCSPDSWSGNVNLKLTDGILENDLFEWVTLKESDAFELVPGILNLLELSKKRIAKMVTEDVLLKVIREEIKRNFQNE